MSHRFDTCGWRGCHEATSWRINGSTLWGRSCTTHLTATIVDLTNRRLGPLTVRPWVPAPVAKPESVAVAA